MSDDHENARPAETGSEAPEHANPRETAAKRLKEAARDIGLASNVVMDNLFDED